MSDNNIGYDGEFFSFKLRAACQITTLVMMQSITFEASDRSRSQPLILIQILASELLLAPIREIARQNVYLNVSVITSRQPAIRFVDI